MRLKILLLFAPLIGMFSCGGGAQSGANDDQPSTTNWEDRYQRVEAKKLDDNMIKLIAEDWMLVTAGDMESHNTMTASWGGMGYVWGMPVSYMFIRDTRYTYEFLSREQSFTLSFFGEEHRAALVICGTKSGRDTNKIEQAGLTAIETPSGLVTFSQARLVLECRKVFVEGLSAESFAPYYKEKIIDEFYSDDVAPHTLFISEITDVWIKK